MNKTLTAHLAVLTANIIYGFNFIIAKGVMPEHIGALGFTALRVVGAGLLFWLTSLFGKYERVERKDLFSLFVASLFGVCINQVTFFMGLSITSPINAAIILTSNPIVVLITAAIILKTRITVQKIIGIAIGLSGAVIIITQGGSMNFSSEMQMGNLLVFINSVSFSIYLVYVKKLMSKYSSQTVVRWIFTFGWFTILPLGLPEVLEADWANIPFSIYLSIGYVIMFTTYISYLFNNYGIKYAGPTVVSTYIYSQPVVASLAAILLGKDNLDNEKIFATVLVFIGVYLVSSNRMLWQKKDVHKSTPLSK